MAPDIRSGRAVTRREAEVLAAVAERLTNSEVAARLYLSERTVESHVSSLLRKLDARNRYELVDLAKEVLEGGSALQARLPAALELLADPGSFVGREGERRFLRDLWSRAVGGRMMVGVLAGEAGIGKSRLAAEFAAEVHELGGRALLGPCSEDGGRPYEPFVHAITDDVAGLADAEIRWRAGPAAEALARVVPELSPLLRVDLPSEVLDVPAAQAEVFAGLHRYLSRAAEGAPVLLIVEDVHWATATTLGALRYLAKASGHARVLVLITTRDARPDLDQTTAMFLTDLARLPSVERLALSGLPEREVAALLHDLGDDADPAEVAAETGGNPLFVKEVARGADERGNSLQWLLARRYALLSEADAGLLDVAAVLGSEFDADILVAAAGKPLMEILESLERAEAAGLVAASPGRPGQFAFTHALLRTARYEGMPVSQRMMLHRQVTHALEPRGGDDRVLPELARHACLAAPLAGTTAALEFAIRAGEVAERSLAMREAADHYQRALVVADLLDPPDDSLRLRLTVRFGEALQGAGVPDWRRVLLEAAAAARVLGDTAALAEVGWANTRYLGPTNPAAVDHEFAAILQEALSALGPEPTAARARTLAAASENLFFTEPEKATAMAEEARQIALQLDEPITLGHVLVSYQISARTPDNENARHPTADALIALGHRARQPAFTALGLAHRAWSYREAGDLTAADAAADAAAALHGDHALPPTHVATAILFRAARAAVTGDLAGAEQLVESVLTIEALGFDPTNFYAPALMMVRHARGRLPEAIPMIELASDQPGIGSAYRAALAAAYAHAGRVEDAGRVVRGYAAEAFTAIPRNLFWLASMAGLAEATEWVRDRAVARSLGAMLEPYTGRIADLPQTMVAHVDLALAQVALAAGDAERSESYAARAVAASRKHGAAVFLGRELVRLAAARRMHGTAGGGVDLLVDEAIEIANGTGAHLIRLEAERYGLVDGR